MKYGLPYLNAPKWLSALMYVIVESLIIPYFPELKAALSIHEIFHLLVITGAVMHFLVIHKLLK